ncbi:MAG: NADP-dependent malic enzyme [Candidatus Micrarchaeota archaeon]|nr:NADP-dependent malic enzyme [Candidatus Micrarchaeota archaeon]
MEKKKEKIWVEAIKLHKTLRGKLAVAAKANAHTKKGLALAYTPGVAYVAKEIANNWEKAYELTLKWNSVAVVSDGTRVLGLGNLGPYAALPVMEGKAVLFKSYANIDAFPICLSCTDADEIVQTVKNISPAFGGINLEDIESPKCFEVEKRLEQELNIPVFHDDQHGTAVVVVAALKNALKFVGKKQSQIKVVIAGAGAAGYAIAKLLSKAGYRNILVCDRSGILHEDGDLPPHKRELAKLNKNSERGSLKDALRSADAFIGVSSPNILAAQDIRKMASDPIIFALSNPIPEISPQEARSAGCAVYGTARADLPNQINNVLGFPGIFRGALLVRAKKITDGMKLAAADAIAMAAEEKIPHGIVVPDAFDRSVVPAVATSVALQANTDGVAQQKKSSKAIVQELMALGLLA